MPCGSRLFSSGFWTKFDPVLGCSVGMTGGVEYEVGGRYDDEPPSGGGLEK
jgi:hypothetical protein